MASSLSAQTVRALLLADARAEVKVAAGGRTMPFQCSTLLKWTVTDLPSENMLTVWPTTKRAEQKMIATGMSHPTTRGAVLLRQRAPGSEEGEAAGEAEGDVK